MTAPKHRALPSDPMLWDSTLEPYKRQVKPLLQGASGLLRALDVSPLEGHEIDSGSTAFGALMYEREMEVSATSLVLIWVGSVCVPRALEAAEKFKEKKSKKVEPSVERAAEKTKTLLENASPLSAANFG